MANAPRVISDPAFFACAPVPTASAAATAAATNLKYKRSDAHHTPTHKNTKIVATLGPASSSRPILARLILAGVDMFRFNFSHGTSEEKRELHTNIRQLSAELHRPVAILADLQGPKFRTGKNEGGQPIPVKNGERVHLVTSEKQQLSRPGSICTGTPHADICIRHLQPEQLVLINDGAVVLKIIERVSTEELICQVIVGGPVGERKGINTPDLHVPVPALTEKDIEDALLALQLGVEWMALSFVQHPDDVIKLRELIKSHSSSEFPPPRIIAKIEKPQAIENIDEIIKVVDGIMVARGDLGVECALETVPLLQKLLIDKSNASFKLCITATQMLESMTSNPFPTRAEVSDVANAVCDGTDAVMLSGETAVGQYPIDTVSMMASIVHNTERSIYAIPSMLRVPSLTGVQHAILQSAVTTANGMSAKAIILVCISYEMGVYMSKLRPPCPVVTIVFVEELARQLATCFSLHPITFPDPTVDTTTDRFLVDVESTLGQNVLINKWLQKDALVVLVSGASPLPGMTNSLQVHRMGSATRKLESLLPPAIALRRLQSMPLSSITLRQEEEKKSTQPQQTKPTQQQTQQQTQVIQSVAQKAAADAIDETLNWAHHAIQEGSQH